MLGDHSAPTAPIVTNDDVVLLSSYLSGGTKARTIHPHLLYAVVLLLACTTSGGSILGTGAFTKRAVSANLLRSEDCNVVADFAFQMLTWLSLLWSMLHDAIGPRGCAIAGLTLTTCGHIILGMASTHNVHSPYVYAVGLGLVGGGGNGAYVSSFQFTTLRAFQKRRGVLTSVLATAFNVAAYPFLLLNAPQLGLGTFFFGYAVFAACAIFVSAAIFPDKAYTSADTPTVFALPKSCSRASSSSSSSSLSSVDPTGGVDARGGGGGGGGVGFRQVLRQTCLDLGKARGDIRTARFWLFVVAFSWGALTQQWGGSAISSGLLFPHAPSIYQGCVVPLLTNASYVFSPLIGWLIDKTGFTYVAVLMVCLMQALTLILWRGASQWAMWAALVGIAALAGTLYTIQYAYLTMTFAPASYPGLLTVTFLVQGTLGFLAWPVLSDLKPFGSDPSLGNFVLMLSPTALFYAWPVYLGLTGRRGARARVVSTASSSSGRGAS